MIPALARGAPPSTRAAVIINDRSTVPGGASMNYRDIISIEPGKRSGKPCIRGMRITVYDVLDYLASGRSIDDVLKDSHT